jgi:amino acid transporter
MTPFGAEIVDWGTLGQVVVYSLAAGVGVAICFSVAIVGATRFADARRNEAPVPAALYGALAVLGLAATVGAVVIGIIVMAQK